MGDISEQPAFLNRRAEAPNTPEQLVVPKYDVPHINILLIGDLNHGKTSLAKYLASAENVLRIRCGCCDGRNFLRVDHTVAKIYKCDGPKNQQGLFCSKGNSSPDEFIEDNTLWKLVRILTFTDVPSHDLALSLMLSGGIATDAAVLVTTANEPFPQPQTIEHLAALKVLSQENIIIAQNKLDLITPQQAMKHYEEVQSFVAGTSAENAPIIPISATKGYNLDTICEYIVRSLPLAIPTRNYCVSGPIMSVFHSSDPNRCGSPFETMIGGELKGTLTQGILRIDDEIELRPGIVTKGADDNFVCTPLYTRVVSLHSAAAADADKTSILCVVPGGAMVTVGTTLDPSVTTRNRLSGQVMGLRGQLPNVVSEITVEYTQFQRDVQFSINGNASNKQQSLTVKFSPKRMEIVMVYVGTARTSARVMSLFEGPHGEQCMKLALTTPLCATIGDRISINQRIHNYWRMVAYGSIVETNVVELSGKSPEQKIDTAGESLLCGDCLV